MSTDKGKRPLNDSWVPKLPRVDGTTKTYVPATPPANVKPVDPSSIGPTAVTPPSPPPPPKKT